jgi:NAD/NADP transhydrogenase beta subunit
LLGTARYQVSPGIVGARFAWYTSVIVIVAGHVLAIYAAHRLALARFPELRAARRSQYPLAALMVGYTMLSLWILAQPVVVK